MKARSRVFLIPLVIAIAIGVSLLVYSNCCQSERHCRALAVRAFGLAILSVGSIQDTILQRNALRDISVAQAEAGEFRPSLETARCLDDQFRASALCDIAVIMAKAGEVRAALKTARGLDDHNRASTVRDIAVAQAEAGCVRAALKTAQGVDGKYKAEALVAIAVVQAKSGNRGDARGTLAKALEIARGIKGYYESADLLGNIAVAYAKTGDVIAALETARSINIDYLPDRAWHNIAVALAETGNDSVPREIAQSLEGFETDGTRRSVLALRAVAVAQARAGRTTVALETARGIIAGIPERSFYSSKTGELQLLSIYASTLRDIAIAQATTGDTRGAVETAHSIWPHWGDRDAAFTGIVIAQAEAGNVEEALSTARSIERIDCSDKALTAIAVAQARAGDAKAALETAQRIGQFDDRSGTDYHRAALTNVAVALANAGMRADARNVFAKALEIARRRDWDYLLHDIAVAQAKVGEAEGALETVQTIKSASDRVNALSDVGAILGDPQTHKGICHFLYRLKRSFWCFWYSLF